MTRRQPGSTLFPYTTLFRSLNGALEAELVVGQPPRFDSIQQAALGSAIDSTGAAAGFFNGVLDEVRIWNYARSEEHTSEHQSRFELVCRRLLGKRGTHAGIR